MGVNRQFIKFYGVELSDWDETFGTFSATHHFMLREYVSEAASSTDSSPASDTNMFLYPFDIERVYYIEGLAEGHITIAASGCTATITDYRVTICKTFEGASQADVEIATTGTITVNDSIAWDVANSIGDEIVYPFFIHISPEAQCSEGERLYLKVECTCSDKGCAILMHSNDASWQDLFIDIPLHLPIRGI